MFYFECDCRFHIFFYPERTEQMEALVFNLVWIEVLCCVSKHICSKMQMHWVGGVHLPTCSAPLECARIFIKERATHRDRTVFAEPDWQQPLPLLLRRVEFCFRFHDICFMFRLIIFPDTMTWADSTEMEWNAICLMNCEWIWESNDFCL